MIAQLQAQISDWAFKNFGLCPPEQPFTGMVEELGELAHARLKMAQGIRGTITDHEEAEKDALADLFIYMCHYADLRDIDLESLIFETWQVVSKRNWKKNPDTGEADDNTCRD